ncbi:MAG: hypothetical protein JO113_05635, partial [Candidatus Eremiobacteraeota bacterium]|nr:hypothetical protein [Candidatus Eremiobacteraeota bacterium]
MINLPCAIHCERAGEQECEEKAPRVSTDTLAVPAPPSVPFVRIVPLGGCGEIGRNMTVVETNDDLVVVDCGLMFPDDEMYGVDIV